MLDVELSTKAGVMFDDLSAYFHEHVWAAYQAYVEARNTQKMGVSRDLRLGIDAAIALYHLREYIPHPQRKKAGELVKLCPDYGLLRDVTNAAKHHTLNDNRRDYEPQITGANDIFEQLVLTRYEDENGEYWHKEKCTLVNCKDGSTRDLYEVLTNVLNMWLQELHRLEVIPYRGPVNIYKNDDIPIRSSEYVPFDLEIIPGVRFKMNMQLRKYNYETGKVESIDLSDKETIFTIYKRTIDLEFGYRNEEAGEEIGGIIKLSGEESQRFLEITNDKDREDFVLEMAVKHGVFQEVTVIKRVTLTKQQNEADTSDE